jgi:arginine deiminase
MTIRVDSELGCLLKVLIHRPGYEIDWMVPSLMERLLFDDILDGEQAREEHDAFTKILKSAGVETVDPLNLLGDVLTDGEVRGSVLRELASAEIDQGLLEDLANLEARDLAAALIQGLRVQSSGVDGRLRASYRLPPVPNYFFQRDPQVVFGDRVMLSSMATEARHREPFLAKTVFSHHPSLAGFADVFELGPRDGTTVGKRPHLEGGDVLVPSEEILLVGVSERTNRRGVETLVRYLQTEDTGFKHLVVVELPPRRSYMHLDTVFTFIDRGLCLAYPPVIAANGSEASEVYYVDLGQRQISYTTKDGLVEALGELGMDIDLVPCGGKDPLDQQREQWTDGANAFAISPGLIVLYRRNRRTVDELSRRGFRIIGEEDVLSGREQIQGQGPTVVTLLGHELSRARGGPRCMTMPLEREPLA